LYISLIYRNCVLLYICASFYISDISLLYYFFSFNIYVYLCVIYPLAFHAKNNPDQDANVENVLLVEDMKHNLLSVSEMCDQGHKLVFDSRKCEIIKVYSKRVVATIVRTPSNRYILNEFGKEKCCLGKED
jgi:hypothetical protein